jgi:tyrosyl-tRNA synthetase
VQKMSKSRGNYVGIDEPPQAMFGKLMSLPDALMVRYYELLSDISPTDLDNLARDLENGAKHPRDAKEELAREITARYHGAAPAADAAREFAQIFREGGLPDDIDEVVIGTDQGTVWLPKLMVEAGLAGSTSEGRRLISQGGVSVDGEKISDVNAELTAGSTFLLQVGKRRFKRVNLKTDK